MNFLIALPAALCTVALLMVLGNPGTAVPTAGDYTFLKVLPYMAVLLLALAGLNVFLVLVTGIFLAGIIGLLGGQPHRHYLRPADLDRLHQHE